VRLGHPPPGHELLVFWTDGHQVNGVASAPDSRAVAAAARDGSVRLWHARDEP
jgi:hypothetical protein